MSIFCGLRLYVGQATPPAGLVGEDADPTKKTLPRSPGRDVDSYIFKSENFLLTSGTPHINLPSPGGRGLRRELYRTMKGRGISLFSPPPHAPRRVHDCPEPYMVQGSPSPLPAPRLSACAKASADRRQAGVERGRIYWGNFKYLWLYFLPTSSYNIYR